MASRSHSTNGLREVEERARICLSCRLRFSVSYASRLPGSSESAKLELSAVSRGSLLPNPEFDRIECILFAFQEQDVVITDPAQRRASYICGCMAVESDSVKPDRMRDARIELFETELDLFNALIDRVKEWDPDILTGWEVQNGSWGYVSERAHREYSALRFFVAWLLD